MTITLTLTGHDWPEVLGQARKLVAQNPRPALVDDTALATILASVEPATPEPAPEPKKSKAVKAAPAIKAEALAVTLGEPATPDIPDPTPVVEDAPDEPPLTYNVLANAILELIRVKGRDAATTILQSYGAATAREVPEARWVDVYNQVKEACL